jgi:hypothetical protein
MSNESNEKSVSQNEVARFLVGLGIGLVVGIIFRPLSDECPRGFHESGKASSSTLHTARAA